MHTLTHPLTGLPRHDSTLQQVAEVHSLSEGVGVRRTDSEEEERVRGDDELQRLCLVQQLIGHQSGGKVCVGV